MKKFGNLFTDSYKELKSVRTITTAAMFAAIAIILGMFSIEIGHVMRIGFSSIPNKLTAYLFGPVVGGIFGGTLDVLKYLIKPTGGYFLPLTLVVVLADVIYGFMYYKKPLSFWRILLASFLVTAVCNVILNTMCLSVLYGKGFWAILPARLVKNLVMWPIDSFIFYSLAKALEALGVLSTIRRFSAAGVK